jgi:hypothetical protein
MLDAASFLAVNFTRGGETISRHFAFHGPQCAVSGYLCLGIGFQHLSVYFNFTFGA